MVSITAPNALFHYSIRSTVGTQGETDVSKKSDEHYASRSTRTRNLKQSLNAIQIHKSSEGQT